MDKARLCPMKVVDGVQVVGGECYNSCFTQVDVRNQFPGAHFSIENFIFRLEESPRAFDVLIGTRGGTSKWHLVVQKIEASRLSISYRTYERNGESGFFLTNEQDHIGLSEAYWRTHFFDPVFKVRAKGLDFE